jgi:hypothetical protein
MNLLQSRWQCTVLSVILAACFLATPALAQQAENSPYWFKGSDSLFGFSGSQRKDGATRYALVAENMPSLFPTTAAGGAAPFTGFSTGNPVGVAPVQHETEKTQAGPLPLFPVTGRDGATPIVQPVLFAASSPAMAGGSAPPSPSASPAASDNDKWEVIFAPYLFLASINGDIGTGRVGTTDVSFDASTVLQKLQFAFMGEFELRKGHWGGMFNLMYVNLGNDITTPTGGVADADLEQTMLEGFLSYRLGSERTFVDLYGGVRYWDMDSDLSVVGPLGSGFVSRGDRWADPIFGARVVHFISKKWFIPARGDIGGFGALGRTSHFTWNVQGGIGYEINKMFAIAFQYKALGDDYDNGQAGTVDFFEYDAIQYGPLFAFVFRF